MDGITIDLGRIPVVVFDDESAKLAGRIVEQMAIRAIENVHERAERLADDVKDATN